MPKEMTINEAISNAKQLENEIYRLTQLRRDTICEEFSIQKYIGQKEEYTAAIFNKKKEEFMKEKKKRAEEFDKQITSKINEVMLLRGAINRKNVEIGQDKNLIKMKWLRMELAELMKELSSSRYDTTLNKEKYEDLGLGKKLKELEQEKNKLDAAIQHLNYSTKISLS